MVETLGWIILFAPLAAAVLIVLFGIHRRRLSALLAVGALLISFVCAGWLFVDVLEGRQIGRASCRERV